MYQHIYAAFYLRDIFKTGFFKYVTLFFVKFIVVFLIHGSVTFQMVIRSTQSTSFDFPPFVAYPYQYY